MAGLLTLIGIKGGHESLVLTLWLSYIDSGLEWYRTHDIVCQFLCDIALGFGRTFRVENFQARDIVKTAVRLM